MEDPGGTIFQAFSINFFYSVSSMGWALHQSLAFAVDEYDPSYRNNFISSLDQLYAVRHLQSLEQAYRQVLQKWRPSISLCSIFKDNSGFLRNLLDIFWIIWLLTVRYCVFLLTVRFCRNKSSNFFSYDVNSSNTRY